MLNCRCFWRHRKQWEQKKPRPNMERVEHLLQEVQWKREEKSWKCSPGRSRSTCKDPGTEQHPRAFVLCIWSVAFEGLCQVMRLERHGAACGLADHGENSGVNMQCCY